jgi:hypothetical protein
VNAKRTESETSFLYCAFFTLVAPLAQLQAALAVNQAVLLCLSVEAASHISGRALWVLPHLLTQTIKRL